MTETKRLGRGLEALLGPVSREQAEASGTLRELPIAQVRPNPYQPRTRIDEPALADTLVQPLPALYGSSVGSRPFDVWAVLHDWRAACERPT